MTSQILVPKKQKINETEEVALPMVKCGVCGNLTTQGLHQTRLILIRKARVQRHKITGKLRMLPPIMRRIDVYMCINCVETGRKWPGENPIYPK